MSTTTPTESPPGLVVLNPNELLDHPDNVRRGLGDLDSLAASIAEVGVLEPLIVTPDDDGNLVVVAGHRRKHAAIKAGRTAVDCVVRPDLSAKAGAIKAMVAENLQRRDLTAAEEAEAFQMLLDLGETSGTIGKLAGMKAADVEASAALTGSKKAHGIAAKHDLSIEHALILAGFEDDKEALKELAVVAVKDPDRFEHAASRIRHDREIEARKAESKAKAKEAGLKIVPSPDYNAKVSEPMYLKDLVAKDGDKLRDLQDGEADGACLDYDGNLKLLVLNPKERGFRKRPSPGSKAVTGPRSDEEKERMRQVVANNKAWPAATDVRLKFVGTLCGRRTPPKGMAEFVARTVIADPRLLSDYDGSLLSQWFTGKATHEHFGGVKLAELTKGASKDRLVVLQFALLASAIEYRLRDKDGWRREGADKGAWLGFLASCGYALSEVEQSLMPTPPKAAPKAA